jgi:hypothetical protein
VPEQSCGTVLQSWMRDFVHNLHASCQNVRAGFLRSGLWPWRLLFQVWLHGKVRSPNSGSSLRCRQVQACNVCRKRRGLGRSFSLLDETCTS